MFSQLGLVQVVVFWSPLAQVHTHSHTHRGLTHKQTHTHTHVEINKNVLREDRISQKVGSSKSTTSLSYFPAPSLTHLFIPLTLSLLFSPTLLSRSMVCQSNLTPAASDTIQTARSPCPTLSPPEPDSKTTRLLPHVPPAYSLSLIHTNARTHSLLLASFPHHHRC